MCICTATIVLVRTRADTCCGTWFHTEVSVNFMSPGHTKFGPDWCFGIVKGRFRRAEVSCLNDICGGVADSTPESPVNLPQLVGRQEGSVIVPTYDWQAYLSPACKPLKRNKKMSHFRFSAANPQGVFHKSSLSEALPRGAAGHSCLRAVQGTPTVLVFPDTRIFSRRGRCGVS